MATDIAISIGLINFSIFFEVATPFTVTLTELGLQLSHDTIDPLVRDSGRLGQLLWVERESGLGTSFSHRLLLLPTLIDAAFII